MKRVAFILSLVFVLGLTVSAVASTSSMLSNGTAISLADNGDDKKSSSEKKDAKKSSCTKSEAKKSCAKSCTKDADKKCDKKK